MTVGSARELMNSGSINAVLTMPVSTAGLSAYCFALMQVEDKYILMRINVHRDKHTQRTKNVCCIE